MTDNEIVKAWIVVLENKRMPTEYLINVTIDRINSLTAEVLRQQAEINVKNRLLDEAKAEIERLKKGWKADVILTANVKSEAYREFAERVKEKSKYVKQIPAGEYFEAVDVEDIDNLLKELVGEEG